MANVAGPTQPEANTAEEDLLRSTFVEMLFALAVSQVAIYAADLVGVDAPWQDKMPAFAHLGVGLVLIAASWVGWRQSAAPGMKERVKSLFSMPFFGLLVDVLLVILYFIIVRNVEIEQKNGETKLALATAEPESAWLCVVFGVYACWDLVTDVLSADCIPKDQFLPRVWKFLRAAFVSAFTSIVCLFGSLFVAYVAATKRTQAHEVLFLDGALVCVIFFFRALKAFENVLAPLLHVTDCKAFMTPRETQGSEFRWGLVLLLLYVVFYAVCLLGGV